MTTINRLVAILTLAFGLAALAGCEQKGAAQKAGEKVDKAVDDASKAVERAGEKVGEKLDEAAKKVRDATK
jgi:hyperosmotically inducible periplasmic protein